MSNTIPLSFIAPSCLVSCGLLESGAKRCFPGELDATILACGPREDVVGLFGRKADSASVVWKIRATGALDLDRSSIDDM